MKASLLLLLICFLSSSLLSQKYYTKEGKITFSSDAPLEKIEGINHKASSVIDISSGNIQWAVLIKAFQFEKALMQEHFNENYMESSKHPKSKFKGIVSNMEEVHLDKDGSYNALVEGQLEIHGVTKDIKVQATFEVADGVIKAHSLFSVKVADYEIQIPGVVKDNIAKEVEIDISANYLLFDKS